MKPVVRAFLFDPNGDILMTRHKKDAPWTLPGGHVEPGEALHDAMIRELREEFDMGGRFFEIDDAEVLHHRGKGLQMHPLPIASYSLTYEDSHGHDKSRTEYIYLMETDEVPGSIEQAEIAEYAWFSPEAILSMQPNKETWDFYIEMLENIIGEDELGE